MNPSSLKQRYKSAYHKTLQEKPAWKKEVITNSTGFNDRVVKEFCREVCELAESQIELN